MVSWEFLLIGVFAAVGAAMAAGTLAALARYRATGMMPGAERPGPLRRGQLVALWARVVLGLGLALAGVAALSARGLL